MKKVIAFFLSIFLAAGTCACGASNGSGSDAGKDTSAVKEEASAEEAAATAGSADAGKAEAEGMGNADAGQTAQGTEAGNVQDDQFDLAAIGDVKVENGVETVTLTMPAALVQGTTQEDLDEGVGTTYEAATLNEDGSITLKLTKEQHKAMLERMSEGFEEGIQGIIDDEDNSITSVTHNEDYSVFDVTVAGTEVDLFDYFAEYSFFTYGETIGIFSGKKPEHVIVNFYDPDGNLIEVGTPA